MSAENQQKTFRSPFSKSWAHFLLCFLIAIPCLGWYFWRDIQIQWNFFLLRSTKKEVADQAREFLVANQQFERLKDALESSNLHVRQQATFAMHQLYQHPKRDTAIPILLQLAKEESNDLKVRWHSIRALGYFRSHKAIPLLIEILIQPDHLCPNPICQEFHLWEESHEALERIFETQHPFEPKNREKIVEFWKNHWKDFQEKTF